MRRHHFPAVRPLPAQQCRRICVVIVLLGFAASTAPAQELFDDGDAALARFLTRTDPTVRTYRALRHMQARNDRLHIEGWLDAVTELTPEHGFRYEIVCEGGSAYIRNRVLRAALETEAKLIAQGEPARASWTPDNYEFVAATTGRSDEDSGLVKLVVRPRRKDVLLVDGALFVNGADGDLVRVEGRLAKSPSFWTRDVRVIRRYERVAGVRVPISLESNAAVRIAGASSMTVTYAYSMVNGVALGIANDE